MASDHLHINIEFLSGSPLRQRGILLYSPSTVKILKEELYHAHGVAVEEIAVYFDGQLMEDTVRVVDKRLYHVKLPPQCRNPLDGGYDEGLGKGVVAVEKGVTFDEGVHVDSMIEVDTTPVVTNARVYMVFAFVDVVRLFDVSHGVILSPTPMMRLGYTVLYVDWDRLRSLTYNVPTDPTTWLYDRVRRDYGVLATSAIFDIRTAPLAELRRYHLAIEGWMIRQPIQSVKEGKGNEDDEGDEDDEDDEDDEESEEQEMELNVEDEMEMDEPWQGTELDDSEWWR